MKKTVIAVAAVLLGQANPAFSQAAPFVDQFNDGVLSESRYKVRTNNDNSTLIVDNGMLRLEAVSDGTASARAALDLVEQTDFIQAVIKLDSTSMAEGAGTARVLVSGVLYNDIRPGGVEGEGSQGDVLAQLSLRLKGDGTLSSLICAFRSDDADFGSISKIVLDGFTECGQFDIDVQFGVPYTASIYIDQENRKLVFKLDGSTIEHVIRGNIFEPSPRAVSSVLALSNGIGKAVAFADDVSNSFDGVAGGDPATDDGTPDNGTTDDGTPDGGTTDDGTTGDGTTDDGTPDGGTTDNGTTEDGTTGDGTTEDGTTDGTADDTTADVPANDAVMEDVLGSSGCSIGGTSASNDPMFLILSAIALMALALRRTPLRRFLPVSKMAAEEKTAIV